MARDCGGSLNGCKKTEGDRHGCEPLTKRQSEAIQDYLPYRTKTTDPHLFVSANGGHRVHGRVVNGMLRTTIRKAGLEGQGITPHKLRHTFATHLIRNGVDIRTVQELRGHADLDTTAKYLHSDTRTKMTAVGRLGGLLGQSRIETSQPNPPEDAQEDWCEAKTVS